MITFSGQPNEDFKGWQRAVTTYLQEWCVDYHLKESPQQDWTELKKYNHRCVFSYLTAIVSGPARTLILSEEVAEDPKKAWDALAEEYDRRTDMEVEVALGEWYRMTKRASETGTQFLTRLDGIADRLAKKKRNQDDKAKLAKVRECLVTDRRYRHVIEGSLLNDQLTYAALRKTIIELDALHSITPKGGDEGEGKEETAMKVQQNRRMEKPKRRQDGSIIRDGNCSHCGKHGHFGFECRNKDKPQTEEGKKIEEEMKKRRGGGQQRGRKCQEEEDSDEEPAIARRVQMNKRLPNYDLIVDSAAYPTLLPNTSAYED